MSVLQESDTDIPIPESLQSTFYPAVYHVSSLLYLICGPGHRDSRLVSMLPACLPSIPVRTNFTLQSLRQASSLYNWWIDQKKPWRDFTLSLTAFKFIIYSGAIFLRNSFELRYYKSYKFSVDAQRKNLFALSESFGYLFIIRMRIQVTTLVLRTEIGKCIVYYTQSLGMSVSVQWMLP